ncbi:ImmA/IrrE family metallo-endopeptidase [Amycolatopsis sp. NPDC005961]|uniref:helix-turn-helix domain-containing protein n=1 Tax=Amycolatopsis sp. NPDC005961 TaxID=3156720 RepID=UPI0033CEE432
MAATHGEIVARMRAGMAGLGLNQQDLAERIGMNPSSFSRALAGQRHFKSVEVALVAEALGLTVGELLDEVGESPQEVMVAARTQPGVEAEYAAALHRVEEFVEINQLLNELGYYNRAEKIPIEPELGIPDYRQGERLAEKLRDKIGLHDGDLPLKLDDFASFVEAKLGIDVSFEPLSGGFDGMSISCDSFKLAAINSRISGVRQRFTLAHELGHIFAGDSQSLHVDENIYGVRSPEERRANAFAAAFLMPSQCLKDATETATIDEDLIADLLGRYRVSLEALTYRLHNIGAINAAERDRIARMSSSTIALRSGRAADLQARNDRRFPELLLMRAIHAYTEARISIRPIAKIAQVPPEALLEDLSPHKFAPPENADAVDA